MDYAPENERDTTKRRRRKLRLMTLRGSNVTAGEGLTLDDGAGTCCVVSDDFVDGDVEDCEADDVEYEQIPDGVNINLDMQTAVFLLQSLVISRYFRLCPCIENKILSQLYIHDSRQTI